MSIVLGRPAWLSALALAVAVIAGLATALALSTGGRAPAPAPARGLAGRGSAAPAAPGLGPPARAVVVRRFAPREVETLALPTRLPKLSVHVPILMYHRVSHLPPGADAVQTDLTLEPGRFDAQLDALQRAGYHTITQTAMFDALYRGAPLPSKPILITADDGYVDAVTQMLPDLRKRQMVATFYVITARLHARAFLDAAQVRELDRAGMDIGSHTRTHVDLRMLSAGRLRAQVSGSRSDLERVLGHAVYWFAYPAGEYDPAVEQAVRGAGYLLATTTHFGTHPSAEAPFALPRVRVHRSTTPAELVALLAAS